MTAALSAFILILKNLKTFLEKGALQGIFLSYLRLTISILNTALCYGILLQMDSVMEKVDSPIVPLILVFFLTLIITSIVMSVFKVVSAAIIQCVLVDEELTRNTGLQGVEGRYRPK